MKFDQTSFFTLHIVTAAHVARPHRYGGLFGNSQELRVLGDRHVSCKLHRFDEHGNRIAILPLDFKQFQVPRTDVSLLRIDGEKQVLAAMESDNLPPIVPFEVDAEPLKKDEEVVALGMHVSKSEETIADNLTMVLDHVPGVLAAKYDSEDFGTTLVARSDSAVPPGLHGGPVVRASNGKVVGVLVAGVNRQPKDAEKQPYMSPPTRDSVRSPEETMALDEWRRRNMHAPEIDISTNGDLMNALPSEGFAFVPVGEFLAFARRSEV